MNEKSKISNSHSDKEATSDEAKLIEDIPQHKRPYPKSVFFIVGNEFCERYSHFGNRALLVLYFMEHLHWSSNLSTAVYHTFIVCCYFMPLFGAILADSYIGKYKTIIYLSLVYMIGNIILTFTSFPPPFWLGPVIGLILLSIGTGGIKPCVSSFGGDQFDSTQLKERQTFFSMFYFSINLGAFTSMIFSPLIKNGIMCFGESCYALAFAVPAILFAISLTLFWIGKRWYVMIPPTGSVFTNFCCCIILALKNKWKHKDEKKEHWLDYASQSYEKKFISDVKQMCRLLIMFIPLPVFWTLFDQQGSRWTIQSTQLDRRIGDNYFLLPEQIQAINPILILVLIPFFEFGIYPLLDKIRIPNKPLQRMVVGLFLTSIAFIAAGFLQLSIQKEFIKLNNGNSNFMIINESPCFLSISGNFSRNFTNISPYKQTSRYVVNSDWYDMTSQFSECSPIKKFKYELELDISNSKYYDFIYAGDINATIKFILADYTEGRSNMGDARVRFINIGFMYPDLKLVELKSIGSSVTYLLHIGQANNSEYIPVKPGHYHTSLKLSAEKLDTIIMPDIFINNGAKYTFLINSNTTRSAWYVPLTDLNAYTISIWWQVPQYVIISIAEILFSITGISFTYSQAPESMKSVVAAFWLMTTGFGNIITAIVSGLHLVQDQATEFFFFAILIFITMIIFAIMAYFYQYTDIEPEYQDLDLQGINPETDEIATDITRK